MWCFPIKLFGCQQHLLRYHLPSWCSGSVIYRHSNHPQTVEVLATPTPATPLTSRWSAFAASSRSVASALMGKRFRTIQWDSGGPDAIGSCIHLWKWCQSRSGQEVRGFLITVGGLSVVLNRSVWMWRRRGAAVAAACGTSESSSSHCLTHQVDSTTTNSHSYQSCIMTHKCQSQQKQTENTPHLRRHFLLWGISFFSPQT